MMDEDNAMSLDDFSALPVTMDQADIESIVDQLLTTAESDSTVSPAEVTEGLIQLIDRQNYNYAPFTDPITQRIEAWAESAWTDDDPSLDDALCIIFATLQAPGARDFLRQQLSSPNLEVRTLAEETIADIDRSPKRSIQ